MKNQVISTNVEANEVEYSIEAAMAMVIIPVAMFAVILSMLLAALLVPLLATYPLFGHPTSWNWGSSIVHCVMALAAGALLWKTVGRFFLEKLSVFAEELEKKYPGTAAAVAEAQMNPKNHWALGRFNDLDVL